MRGLVSSGRFAFLSIDSDEDGIQAVSVRSAISHAINCGRIAAAASPVPRRAPRRLRLITQNPGDTSQASTVVHPIQSVVDALEYDLTRADSDRDTPLPMFSCNRRWIVRRRHHDLNHGMGAIPSAILEECAILQDTAVGRPCSPCPSLIHDFRYDLSMGQDEVGGHLLFPVGEPAAIRGPAATEPDGSSTEPLIHGSGG